jgi:8-oxo-dGTP pyrophosphatase MutT (NUDIX family)
VVEAVWKPHATVASICELDGRYLLVREEVDGCIVYNQPAGHLEPGESLIDAVIRETLEETRYPFKPLALQGVYRFQPRVGSDTTYLRFGFRGEVGARLAGELDQGIIAAEWLSYDEVVASRAQHRSPMVLQCIDDYRDGPGYPLDVISRAFT